MLLLGDRYDFLDRIPGNKTILGFCNNHVSDDHVIISFNSSINLYDETTRNLIKSWAPKKNFQITSPAIYSAKESELIFVMNENVLTSVKSDDYEKSQTFTLQVNIHSVVTNFENEPLVVLVDGSVYLASQCMENPKEITEKLIIDKDKNDILFSVVLKAKDTESFLVSTLIQETEKNYSLVLHPLGEENDDINKNFVKLEIDIDNEILDVCQTSLVSKPDVLVLVCKDGSIYTLQICFIDDSYSIETKSILSLDLGNVSTVVPLSSGEVAVLCKDNCINIVALKLEAVIKKINLGGRVKISNMYSLNQTLFVKTVTMLYAYPFTNENTSLSVAVNHATNAFQTMEVIDKEIGSSPVEFSESDMETQPINGTSNKDLATVLLNTTNTKEFEKTWKKLWKLKNKYQQLEFIISPEIKNILQRFDATDIKFWPREALVSIIQTGQLPGRFCSGLIKIALSKSDWDFVLEFLTNTTDFPESIAVSVLHHTFKLDTDLNNSENISDEITTVKSCIDIIISNEFTDLQLKKNLQNIPMEIILKILNYLINMMDNVSITKTSPSIDNVISWISLILDSHLSSIVLMEEAWKKISDLQRSVLKQLEISKELSGINMFLHQIESKLVIASPDEYTKYVVDVIEF